MSKKSIHFCGTPLFLGIIFVLLLSNFIIAQTVSGVVSDEQGKPMPSANIIIEGTTTGTATSLDGSYTLKLPDGPGPFTLKVSFIGYETVYKKIDADTKKIDFVLYPSANSLKDIVVTAENRAQSAQSVPISMDLISGREMTREGATDLNQLQNIAPGLNIVQNTVFSQVTVRGIGSHDGAAELSDQAILIGVDGEYINRPVALNATLMDIERVEVLKGPQGTLYGRNATAGAVNIIANKPVLNSTEGDLSLSYGNFNTQKLNAAFNLPLGSAAALRVAGMLSKHDGYIDAGEAGKVDDANTWGARLGLLLKPIDALSIYVAGEYNKTDQTAVPQYGVSVPGADSTLTGQIPSNFKTDLPDEFELANAGFLEIDQTAFRANIEYDLGVVQLAYKGGFRNIDMYGYQPLNGFVPETFSFDNDLEYNTHSHEFLIKGDAKNLFWQAGYFYGSEDQDVRRGLVLPVLAGAFGGQVPYNNFTIYDVSSTTNGIFGQATYSFTKEWAFTGGLRYTMDKKERTGSQLSVSPFSGTAYFYPNPPSSANSEGMAPNPGSGDWSQVTWMMNLDYKFGENKMMFAKVSTGYKAGGFDNLGSYDPEKLTAFEIGTKNTFMDNRLRFNAAAFYYNYTDQQVKVFINTEVGDATKNAASTKVFGLELDGEMKISPADHAKLTVNYLNAEYGDFITPMNVVGADAIEVNAEGNKPPQSPELTVVAGYDHDFDIGYGKITAGIKTMFKSDYYLTMNNWEMDKQEAYTNTDFTISYTAKSHLWDVGLFVHNLEDNRIITYSAFTGGGIDLYNWIFGSPRTFGARVNYYFR